MKEQSIVNYLTYQEKIDILNCYFKENATTNPIKAHLAQNIAQIYQKSVKMDYVLATDVCDEILRSSAKITRSKAVTPSTLEKNREPRLIAKIAPEIIEFNPSKQDVEKINILKKYLAKEIEKQKQNTAGLEK